MSSIQRKIKRISIIENRKLNEKLNRKPIKEERIVRYARG